MTRVRVILKRKAVVLTEVGALSRKETDQSVDSDRYGGKHGFCSLGKFNKEKLDIRVVCMISLCIITLQSDSFLAIAISTYSTIKQASNSHVLHHYPPWFLIHCTGFSICN